MQKKNFILALLQNRNLRFVLFLVCACVAYLMVLGTFVLMSAYASSISTRSGHHSAAGRSSSYLFGTAQSGSNRNRPVGKAASNPPCAKNRNCSEPDQADGVAGVSNDSDRSDYRPYVAISSGLTPSKLFDPNIDFSAGQTFGAFRNGNDVEAPRGGAGVYDDPASSLLTDGDGADPRAAGAHPGFSREHRKIPMYGEDSPFPTVENGSAESVKSVSLAQAIIPSDAAQTVISVREPNEFSIILLGFAILLGTRSRWGTRQAFRGAKI